MSNAQGSFIEIPSSLIGSPDLDLTFPHHPFLPQLKSDIFANNPALMNALQGRINDLIGKSSGYIESLPKNVLNRVHALENLQVRYFNSFLLF